MKRLTKGLRWLPAVLWLAVIFWLSSRTGNEIGSMFPFADRLPAWVGGLNFGHFIAYYVLAFLIWLAFGSDRPAAKAQVVALCALYGITDEFHQLFVDGRTADWLDWRNDVIGAILAMLTVSVPSIRRLIRKIGLG